ncbi:MAG: GrpB family protein [Polyangiaceae bacterium]
MTTKSPFDNPGDRWPTLDVRVLPYDPDWAVRFVLEADLLRTALGATAHTIEHFGSTSVPGMRAKPIIDIFVELTGPLLPHEREALRQQGYVHERQVDDPEIVFLGKGAHEVHLQLVPRNHGSVIAKRALRDYLRAHAHEARAYADVKTGLAASTQGVARDYALGKRAYVDALEGRALAWYVTTHPSAGNEST